MSPDLCPKCGEPAGGALAHKRPEICVEALKERRDALLNELDMKDAILSRLEAESQKARKK